MSFLHSLRLNMIFSWYTVGTLYCRTVLCCNVAKSSIVVFECMYVIPLSRTFINFISAFGWVLCVWCTLSKPNWNLVAFRKMGLPLQMKRNSVYVFVVCIQPNSIENIIHRFSKEMLIATATVCSLYGFFFHFIISFFSQLSVCVSLVLYILYFSCAIVCPIHVRQALSTSV